MKRKSLIFSLLFSSILFIVLFTTSFASQDKVVQARIHLTPEIKTENILALQLDVAYVEPGEYLDFITDWKQIKDLRQGIPYSVIHWREL